MGSDRRVERIEHRGHPTYQIGINPSCYDHHVFMKSRCNILWFLNTSQPRTWSASSFQGPCDRSFLNTCTSFCANHLDNTNTTAQHPQSHNSPQPLTLSYVTMAASPSSSPRLPSPPPIAEDQLGPKSPITMPNEHGELGRNPFEANASRRIRPGTKAADMALGPPLVPLTDVNTSMLSSTMCKTNGYTDRQPLPTNRTPQIPPQRRPPP
jgi:hypothetical protein